MEIKNYAVIIPTDTSSNKFNNYKINILHT
jgi:hypothetical protein